jgi:hypothetical protein
MTVSNSQGNGQWTIDNGQRGASSPDPLLILNGNSGSAVAHFQLSIEEAAGFIP